jgi:hypothetical protein
LSTDGSLVGRYTWNRSSYARLCLRLPRGFFHLEGQLLVPLDAALDGARGHPDLVAVTAVKVGPVDVDDWMPPTLSKAWANATVVLVDPPE